MTIFGYFILVILIQVVTAKPFENVGVIVLFIMSEVSPGATELINNHINYQSVIY